MSTLVHDDDDTRLQDTRDERVYDDPLRWLKRDAALNALQDAAEQMRLQAAPLPFERHGALSPLVPRALRAIEPPSEGDVAIRQFGRLAIAVTAAVVVAGAYVLAADSLAQGKSGAQHGMWGFFSGQTPEQPRDSARPAPRITVENRRGEINQPMALGIELQRAPPDAVVLVTGIMSGTQLTAGAPAGPNGWSLPVRDVANVQITPPKDFVGVMDLAIELQLADAWIAANKVMRIEWTAASEPQAVAPPPSPPPVVRQSQLPARDLDREEVVNLVKRGEAYLQSGDLAAARLVLRRAAEAGSARAAFALAATFDPRVLKESGLIGAVPDAAQARAWYEKAKEFGSLEAPQRLEQLAQNR